MSAMWRDFGCVQPARCCQSILPQSSHPNDCCAAEPSGGQIHTTRPELSFGVRPGNGRNGLITGRRPGNRTEWRLFDRLTGRRQPIAAGGASSGERQGHPQKRTILASKEISSPTLTLSDRGITHGPAEPTGTPPGNGPRGDSGRCLPGRSRMTARPGTPRGKGGVRGVRPASDHDWGPARVRQRDPSP